MQQFLIALGALAGAVLAIGGVIATGVRLVDDGGRQPRRANGGGIR